MCRWVDVLSAFLVLLLVCVKRAPTVAIGAVCLAKSGKQVKLVISHNNIELKRYIEFYLE
jgi:hypothetical protein